MIVPITTALTNRTVKLVLKISWKDLLPEALEAAEAQETHADAMPGESDDEDAHEVMVRRVL